MYASSAQAQTQGGATYVDRKQFYSVEFRTESNIGKIGEVSWIKHLVIQTKSLLILDFTEQGILGDTSSSSKVEACSVSAWPISKEQARTLPTNNSKCCRQSRSATSKANDTHGVYFEYHSNYSVIIHWETSVLPNTNTHCNVVNPKKAHLRTVVNSCKRLQKITKGFIHTQVILRTRSSIRTLRLY